MERTLREKEKRRIVAFVCEHDNFYTYKPTEKRCDMKYSINQIYETFKNDKEWFVERTCNGHYLHFIKRKDRDLKIRTMLHICKMASTLNKTVVAYGGFPRACVGAILSCRQSYRYLWLAMIRKKFPLDVRKMIFGLAYRPLDDGTWFGRINDLDLMFIYPKGVDITELPFETHVRQFIQDVNTYLYENNIDYCYTSDVTNKYDGSGDTIDNNFQRNGEHRSDSQGDFFNYQVCLKKQESQPSQKYYRYSNDDVRLDITTMKVDDHVDADVNNLIMVYDKKKRSFVFKQRKTIRFQGRLVTMNDIMSHIERHTFLQLFPERKLFHSMQDHHDVVYSLLKRWRNFKSYGWKVSPDSFELDEHKITCLIWDHKELKMENIMMDK